MSQMSDEQVLEEKRQYKKLKKKLIRAAELEKKAALQVTSLMDIFVNVLIYLLMNYSTSPVDVAQSKERMLPKSSARDKLTHTTTIGVTKNSILVNRKKVVELIQGRVDPNQKDGRQASSYRITRLYEVLKKDATEKKKIAKRNSSVKFKGEVTIVADEDMSFRLLSEIMYTAGQAEFGRFKFAVIKKGGA